ncbi:hypothetical protein PG984_005887 [Apiospora sp. TS-2023a]
MAPPSPTTPPRRHPLPPPTIEFELDSLPEAQEDGPSIDDLMPASPPPASPPPAAAPAWPGLAPAPPRGKKRKRPLAKDDDDDDDDEPAPSPVRILSAFHSLGRKTITMKIHNLMQIWPSPIVYELYIV